MTDSSSSLSLPRLRGRQHRALLRALGEADPTQATRFGQWIGAMVLAAVGASGPTTWSSGELAEAMIPAMLFLRAAAGTRAFGFAWATTSAVFVVAAARLSAKGA